MSTIIKLTSVCIFCFLLLLNLGCKSSTESKKEISDKENTNTKALVVLPQYDFIETEKYIALKKQIEEMQNKVKELEIIKSELLVKYTEDYSKVKIVSEQLKRSKEKFVELESELKIEEKKLAIKPKKLPVKYESGNRTADFKKFTRERSG